MESSLRFAVFCICTAPGLRFKLRTVRHRSVTHLNSNRMLSSTAFPATRMAVQALSNIVTTNEDLTSRLWNTYLTLPEEQAILM